MALFQAWMLVKHYSWPRRYCSAWCHWFFWGLGLSDIARRGANCEAVARTPLGWTQWTSCTSLSWSVVGRRLKLDQQVTKYWKLHEWTNIEFRSASLYHLYWLLGYIIYQYINISYRYHIDIIYIYKCTYTYIIYYRSVQMSHRNCLGSCKISHQSDSSCEARSGRAAFGAFVQ